MQRDSRRRTALFSPDVKRNVRGDETGVRRKERWMGGGSGSLSVQAWSPGGSTVGKGDPCSCHCGSFSRLAGSRGGGLVSFRALRDLFFLPSSLPLFLDFILTVKDVGGFRKTPSDESGQGLSTRISLVLHIQSPPLL